MTPLKGKTSKNKLIEELKKRRSAWVVRLIKLGEAKIPESGFYIFDDPETDAWLSQALDQYKSQLVESVEETIKTWEHPEPISTDDIGAEVRQVLQDIINKIKNHD